MTTPYGHNKGHKLATGARSLKRWFGNLQVVEAKKPIRIQPTAVDIKGAVRHNPTSCAFSRACRRMWDSKTVLFFGTVAYVDLLGPDGVRRVERFNIGTAAQRFILNFDRGKKVSPAGFSLSPPGNGDTLKSQAKRNHQYRKAALLKGRSTGKHAAPKPRTVRLSMFRNGKGMVQFPAHA